ncbi:unnamed protein product [Heligmosomoides polygyrus]|uniref:Bestrophin homolog n=1 Tax=Heligmosomoides polygyrus TaxID=6339 RepID=A0A183F8F3_HELPZ|nr:unnamed protein product [Heligmosomoides polygyrus]
MYHLSAAIFSLSHDFHTVRALSQDVNIIAFCTLWKELYAFLSKDLQGRMIVIAKFTRMMVPTWASEAYMFYEKNRWLQIVSA